MKKHAFTVLSIITLLAILPSCKRSNNYSEVEGEVFHTYYHIKYKGETSQSEAIVKALHYIDTLANPFNPVSLLYAINNNHKQWHDDGLVYLFNKAKQVAQASEGKYDITVGPMVNLWGFGYEKTPYKQGNVPQEAIDSIRQFVGINKVWISGDTIAKADPRVSIDMASIAKGFASDKVAEQLENNGITNYMVEIGGEIAYSGNSPRGTNWEIGVNVPTLDKDGSENGKFDAILRLEGKGGVATSGNYRNYVLDEKGNMYAHTIDPIQGRPVQLDVLSATIIAPDCTTADALATACMLVGSEKALRLVQQFPGCECLLLVADGNGNYKRVSSPGIKKLIIEPNNK